MPSARAEDGAEPAPEDESEPVPVDDESDSDVENYDAYVCGPRPWMDAVVRDLRAAGIPPRSIHTESFTI